MDHAEKIVVNRMTTRRDRRSPALDPAYVRIDERGLPELIDFAAKVAPLVRYHGPSNQPDGDFGEFFTHDRAMALASIAASPLREEEEAFTRLEREARAAPAPARKPALREVFAAVAALARRCDRWVSAVEGSADAACEAIAAALREALRSAVPRLRCCAEAAGLRVTPGQPMAADDEPWWSRWSAGAGPETTDHALPVLSGIWGALRDAIGGVQPLARAHLDGALGEGGHPPHLALYLAFTKLFQHAQRTLDGVTARYADFYRRDVLREPPRGPVGDAAYLTFTLAASDEVTSVTSAVVPAGTRFSAGPDAEGAEIVFASTRELRVGAGRVEQVCALRITRGSPPGDEAGAAVVQHVLEAEVTPGAAPWALFGSPAETSATLGFAIASPHLHLSGGRRTVEVWLRCSGASLTAIGPMLAQIAASAGLPQADALRRVLADAFELHVSTASKWLPIDYRAVVHDDVLDAPYIALVIDLPAGAPPLGPLDPAIAAAGLDATVPAPGEATLKAYLRQDPSTLAILCALEVDALWLRTEVSDLTGLTLTNPGGPVGAEGAFLVFGGAPRANAYLDVSHPEIFARRIDGVSVRIDWLDLPPNDTGFEGWYRGYSTGLDGLKRPGLLDNRTFRVSLRAIEPGRWRLGADAQDRHLFATKTSVAPDAPDAKGALAETVELGPFVAIPREPPAFHDGSKSAIRISLTAPPEAFGDSVHAQNVLAAVSASSLRQSKAIAALGGKPTVQEIAEAGMRAAEISLPNPPWLPQAKRVSLGYTATCMIVGKHPAFEGAEQAGTLFHLLPFGGFRAQGSHDNRLLPALDDLARDHTLLLGLSGLVPGESLTMLVQLADGDTARGAPPAVAWECLSNNAWIPLSAGFDDTAGLQRTGLLALTLPPGDLLGNTVLPGGLAWIRARGAGRFPGVASVALNTVLATWQDNGNTGHHLAEPRPPGSIKASIDDLPGIETIDQPMASFGGIPPEMEASVPVRLVERLRHKNRAVTGWDHERLVLDRFPEVDRVRTLPARSDAPGEVTVVVLPGERGYKGTDLTAPVLSAGTLAAIEASLAEVTSPFVTVRAVNPDYVRITVEARVELEPGVDPALGKKRLNAALVAALSPWCADPPWAASGPGYPTDNEIAALILGEPYVTALLDLRCACDPAGRPWYFLTSAIEHEIRVGEDL